NVDLVTVAVNMMSHGVDSGLDFSRIMDIREAYERFTGMRVHERTPYAGDLVFTAFSGSHQDAISKGMTWLKEGKSGKRWDVPYLPIDPADVGREYESDVIRINSVSGKGGVSFVLKQQFGFALPEAMKEEVGYLVKGISDRRHQELLPKEIYEIFKENYVNPRGIFNIPECHFKQEDGILAQVTVEQNGEKRVLETRGNGRLDAVSNAIKTFFGIDYKLSIYEEHAISKGSDSKAAAYVGIMHGDKYYWGVGVDEDIIKSSVAALVSATNKLAQEYHITAGREERTVEIVSYIQKNYMDVTLDSLAEHFHLSKPYLSKYIKDKTGMTFQDAVKEARMKKAKTLLKESEQTVESIAALVGYDNVEHFNRLFKKSYGVTPIQYRKNP
nr:helix-turn-helix domain-containing protein [Acetatifactor sp.]